MMRTETIGDCTSRNPGDGMTSIYALCEPDFTPRYVGKTVNWLHVRHKNHIRHVISGRNSHLPVVRWIKKKITASERLVIKLLEYVPKGEDWAAREKYWINKLRNETGNLLNLTDGGEGLSGHRYAGTGHAHKIAAALRTGEHRSCQVCGAQFWRKLKEIKLGNCRFCSRSCYATSIRGTSRPVSDICKEKGIAAAAAARSSKSNCKRGHALSGTNLFLTSKGSRSCKECRKIHKATYHKKRADNG